ncbi:MAG: TRAP transporter substrate-binding protein [Rhodocyclaceae bacterium]|nr:TRAP transporter substrate-binding protein [Rhodocyclaceae bacterium]
MNLLAAVTVFALGVSGSALAAPKELRLGGVHSPTSFETRGLEQFAKLVAEKSGGTLKVNIFPAGQLGDAVSMIENVMMGALDMFANVADWNQNVVKDYGIMAMPFAFRNQAHMTKFLNGEIYAGMKKEMLEKKKLRVIADNWYRVPRVLVTKFPVNSLKDLEDKKFRLPSIKTYVETWKALGMKPTILPWAESYLALKTGVVDGMDSPFSSVYSEKFYQAAPYITMTNHAVAPLNILISDVVFQKLSAEQQEVLMIAGKEAGAFYTKLIEAQLDVHKTKMTEEGAKIADVDVRPFVDKARGVAEKFEKDGDWTPGLFDKVSKL